MPNSARREDQTATQNTILPRRLLRERGRGENSSLFLMHDALSRSRCACSCSSCCVQCLTEFPADFPAWCMHIVLIVAWSSSNLTSTGRSILGGGWWSCNFCIAHLDRWLVGVVVCLIRLSDRMQQDRPLPPGCKLEGQNPEMSPIGTEEAQGARPAIQFNELDSSAGQEGNSDGSTKYISGGSSRGERTRDDG